MTKRQSSKRVRRTTPPPVSTVRGKTAQDFNNPAFIYRRAEEPSIRHINNATRTISTRTSLRITDDFTTTLVYPHKLRALRERSELPNPLRLATLVKQLGGLQLASLYEPVTARILNVRAYNKVVGITIDYPEYAEEASKIQDFAARSFGLNASDSLNIGPGELHLSIMVGTLSASQVRQVKSALPDVVRLSPAYSGPNLMANPLESAP